VGTDGRRRALYRIAWPDLSDVDAGWTVAGEFWEVRHNPHVKATVIAALVRHLVSADGLPRLEGGRTFRDC
jgi:hypothetical protein